MTARRHLARIPDALLTLAAIVGLLAIIAALAAHLFGVSISLFRTGSMEPTIATGSAAIAVERPAADIRIGDIVMVDRQGQLPITHRVVEISGTGSQRELTLKGDANASPDPYSYSVQTVHEVVFVVPKAAHILAWFSDPRVLGALTFAATALVLWAFWPRRDPITDAADADDDADADHTGDDAANTGRNGLPPDILVASEPTPHHGASFSAVALAAVVGLLPQPALTPEVRVVHGSVITLTSISFPDQMKNLSPGTPVEWIVGVEADAPTPGNIHIDFEATGSLTQSLTASIDECTLAWVAGTCSTGSTRLRQAIAVALPKSESLTSIKSTSQRWFKIIVELSPDAPRAIQGQSVHLTIRATGLDDTVAISPGPPPNRQNPESGPGPALPPSGAQLELPILLAAATLTTGSILLARHRRRP